MQCAVTVAASLFTGGIITEGQALLRSSPAGNLSPYRSRSWSELRTNLRDISVGKSLIRLAQPRIVVLLFSEFSLWHELMGALDRTMPTTEIQVSEGAGYTLRESVGGAAPEYVFGLPGMNTQTSGHNEAVLKTLHKRITLHDLGNTRA